MYFIKSHSHCKITTYLSSKSFSRKRVSTFAHSAHVGTPKRCDTQALKQKNLELESRPRMWELEENGVWVWIAVHYMAWVTIWIGGAKWLRIQSWIKQRHKSWG